MSCAEQIYHNGIVATIDDSCRFAEAVAVRSGIIIAVGTTDEIAALGGNDTEWIDLKGGMMLPGMCDAHVHASDFIHNLEHLACDHLSSIEAVKMAVNDKIDGNTSEWLIGNGLLQGVLDDGICRHDLDEVAPERPVVLIMWHGHGCVANTAALKKSGIDANTPNPPGGIIRREKGGIPNGILEEASALQLVFTGMNSFSSDQIAVKLKRMQQIMNSMGYTAYTESTVGPANNLREGGASGDACLEAYVKVLLEGKMTCRVSVGVYSGRYGKQSYEILREDLKNNVVPEIPQNDWLSFHMLKFFCDGVETSHTAWMKQDYADAFGVRDSSCFGDVGYSEKEQIYELRRTLQLAHDSGYQIGIHTVGNKAVHEAIEAIIAAQVENPRENCRHYLIHADTFGDYDDLVRCPINNIIISSQPNLTVKMFERAAECVGGDISRHMMPLRKLFDSGITIAGGSDSIAGDYHDWRYGIQAAVLRAVPGGQAYHTEYSITVEEAVKMYTINAAYQEFADEKRGSIECGKFADFTIIDRNIFEIPPEEITDIKVIRTVVGGKTVYNANLPR